MDILTASEMVLGTIFITDKGTWTQGTVYETNDIVHTDNGVYMSLVDGNSSEPSSAPAKWRTWVDKTSIKDAISISALDQFDYAKLVGANAVKSNVLYIIKAVATSQLKCVYYKGNLYEVKKETSTLRCTDVAVHGTENGWRFIWKGEPDTGDNDGVDFGNEGGIGDNIHTLNLIYNTLADGVAQGSVSFTGTDTLRELNITISIDDDAIGNAVDITLDNIPLLTKISVTADPGVTVVIEATGREESSNDSWEYSKKLQYLLPDWDATAGGVQKNF